MKNNKLELLDVSLLHVDEFKVVQYWLDVFRAEIGWHYYLDLIWQLKEIKKLNLPKGATIIDAGAGIGMMQFILASLGYNVISIDFNERESPKLYSKIFNLQYDNNRSFKNEYINHLNNLGSKTKNRNYILKVINILNHKFILEYIKTRFTPYGKIKFISADFSNLDFLPDNSIDAIVSTSAIEHNENIEKLSLSIKEFERVLKKDASMLITTSATNVTTWWHEPSKGYCFSESDLGKIFNISNYQTNFNNYKQIFSNIKDSSFLKAKLPSFYSNNPNCGMPYGNWDPKYIPVGIIKNKF